MGLQISRFTFFVAVGLWVILWIALVSVQVCITKAQYRPSIKGVFTLEASSYWVPLSKSCLTLILITVGSPVSVALRGGGAWPWIPLFLTIFFFFFFVFLLLLIYFPHTVWTNGSQCGWAHVFLFPLATIEPVWTRWSSTRLKRAACDNIRYQTARSSDYKSSLLILSPHHESKRGDFLFFLKSSRLNSPTGGNYPCAWALQLGSIKGSPPASRCEAMRLTAVSLNLLPWLLTDPGSASWVVATAEAISTHTHTHPCCGHQLSCIQFWFVSFYTNSHSTQVGTVPAPAWKWRPHRQRCCSSALVTGLARWSWGVCSGLLLASVLVGFVPPGQQSITGKPLISTWGQFKDLSTRRKAPQNIQTPHSKAEDTVYTIYIHIL